MAGWDESFVWNQNNNKKITQKQYTANAIKWWNPFYSTPAVLMKSDAAIEFVYVRVCTRICLICFLFHRMSKNMLTKKSVACIRYALIVLILSSPKITKKKKQLKKTQTTESWKSVTSEDLSDNHIRMRHVRVKCLYAPVCAHNELYTGTLLLADEMRRKKNKEKKAKNRSTNKEWKMHDKVFG